MIFEINKEMMNLKNSIPSNKLHFVEFTSYGKPACVNCNEQLKEHDVMVLDYNVISYGYQNSNYKIILAYTESDKKNIVWKISRIFIKL